MFFSERLYADQHPPVVDLYRKRVGRSTANRDASSGMDFEPPAVFGAHKFVVLERPFSEVAGEVWAEIRERVKCAVLVAKGYLGAVGFEHSDRPNRQVVRPANFHKRRHESTFFVSPSTLVYFATLTAACDQWTGTLR
jgi:hypothetical protein